MLKDKVLILLTIAISLYGASTNKDFILKDGKSIILNEPTNTHSTKIKSNDNLNTNITLTLPATPPGDNQVLVVDSEGVLSWADKQSTGSDNQKIDKFILDGNQIKLSLEGDGEADKVIDLSSITAFLKATDIKDNLTSTDKDKPLSANQGKELKALVDALNSSLSNHISNTSNPHNVTKAQVGLANVDNTSDADKPISTATKTALEEKADKTTLAELNSTVQTNTNNISELNSTIQDINNSIHDTQGIDIFDFNGTYLTVSLENNDTNKTVALDRNLSSLSDVNLSNLSDKQVLQYNSNTKKWESKTLNIAQNTQKISDINNTLTYKINEVNTTAKTNESNITKLSGYITELNTTVKNNENNISSLSSRIITNESNISTLSNRVDNVESNISQYSSTIETLTATTQINTDNINDLNNTIKTNTSNIDELNTSIKDINSTKINIADIVNELNSTDTNKPLSANQGRVLKEMIANINSSSDTLNSKVDELNTTITSNKNNISDINSSLNSKINDLNTSTKTVLDSKADKTTLSDINSTVQTNSNNINDLNNTIKTNISNINELNTSINELNPTIQSNKTTINDINTSLNSRINEVNSTAKTNENNISTLNQKLQDVNNSIHDTQGIDILDFNGTHLTISLENNDTNKTVALDRNLSSLSDINLSNLSNGQVLQYNSDTNRWEPKTLNVAQNTQKISDINTTLTSKINEVNSTIQTNKTTINDINTSLNSKIDDLNTSTKTALDAKADKTTLSDINSTVNTNKTDISSLSSKISDLNTTKVNTSDIQDNLTSTDTNKPLSANQGKVLKELITDVNSSATLWSESGGDIVRSSGNVGIGTSNPQANLHISSGTSGDSTVIIESDTDNNDENENDNPKLILKQDGGLVDGVFGLVGIGGQIFTDSITNALYISSDTDHATSMQFVTEQKARVTIQGDGNVGIGTTNPARKLHINGILRLEPTSEPSNPAKGDIYMDDNTSKLRVYDGSDWHDLW